MNAQVLRTWLAPLRRTPFHPQWLVSDDQSWRTEHLQALSGLVLDIGCSDKSLARHLPASCQYIGLDYYATAHGVYGTRPDVYADAGNLPICNQSLDTVLLFEVLEHVPDPESTVAEIARVLHPGGRLLLSVPFLYPIHDAPYDFHRFTRHALVALMQRNAMVIELIRPRLRSLEVAGLLTSLALGDAAKLILERHRWAFPAVIPLAVMVLLSNVCAWLLARVLPGSDFMPGGYEVVATRSK